MYYGTLVMTLFTACLLVPEGWAQEDETSARRWTLRVFYSLPDNSAAFNSRGLVDFLENNGFGDDASNWFTNGVTEYPVVWTENASRSVYAAFAIRPYLSIGGLYYNAQKVGVSGRRYEPEQETSFRITLQQTMWALAPIALWSPIGFVDVGAGPAFIRGGAGPYDMASEQRVEAQETSFQRLGAVIFVSLGFTVLNRTLYLGLQGQYLYGGTVEIGPYDAAESFAIFPPFEVFTLDAQETRIDQLTWGPAIAVNF
jgi:hypothetical protein